MLHLLAVVTLINFNSIKVRLKLTRSLITKSGVQKFQFHKGTIKTLLDLESQMAKYVFQFHKGTIKTINDNYLPNLCKFQFHKGTIKTGKNTIQKRGSTISIP